MIHKPIIMINIKKGLLDLEGHDEIKMN